MYSKFLSEDSSPFNTLDIFHPAIRCFHIYLLLVYDHLSRMKLLTASPTTSSLVRHSHCRCLCTNEICDVIVQVYLGNSERNRLCGISDVSMPVGKTRRKQWFVSPFFAFLMSRCQGHLVVGEFLLVAPNVWVHFVGLETIWQIDLAEARGREEGSVLYLGETS